MLSFSLRRAVSNSVRSFLPKCGCPADGKLTSLFLFSSLAAEYPSLHATPRSINDSGSRKSRKLREGVVIALQHFSNCEREVALNSCLIHFLFAAGLIPGVLYGVDNDRNDMKQLVSVKKRDILKELRNRRDAFENTIYELVVEDDEGSSNRHLVTPRQAQFNPSKCYSFNSNR